MATATKEPLLGAEAYQGQDDDDVNIQRRLLLSHFITRMGTQGWLFVTPLFLLRYTPGTLLGPGLFGLCVFGSGLLIGPRLGKWADVEDRLKVVRSGVMLQAVAVSGNVLLILATSGMASSAPGKAPLFLPVMLACCFGVLEKLSFPLTDVPVKRDWVPTLLMHNKEFLKTTNQRMSQLDLISETLGPFLAGVLVQLPVTYDITLLPSVLTPEVTGFVVVGILNALSCFPQLLLLQSVYNLKQEKLRRSGSEAAKQKEKETEKEKEKERATAAMPQGPWLTWLKHPFGVPVLSSSYAILYFTVLSSHGGLFTAFMLQAGVPAPQLSLFRGAGALVGIIGVTARPKCVTCCSDNVASLLNVGGLAACIVSAALCFHVTTSAPTEETRMLYLYIFGAFVVLGRPFLYAFELGVLNQVQVLVDERNRAAMGAVDDATLSGMTLAIYACGTIFNRPDQFGGLVNVSAVAISMGFLVYGTWLLLFHEHRHQHGHSHGEDDQAAGHGHGHSHDDHPHTPQVEREIDEKGWHTHVHFNPVWSRF